MSEVEEFLRAAADRKEAYAASEAVYRAELSAASHDLEVATRLYKTRVDAARDTHVATLRRISGDTSK